MLEFQSNVRALTWKSFYRSFRLNNWRFKRQLPGSTSELARMGNRAHALVLLTLGPLHMPGGISEDSRLHIQWTHRSLAQEGRQLSLSRTVQISH